MTHPPQTTRILTTGSRPVRVMQKWKIAFVDGPRAGRAVEIATPRFCIGSSVTNDLVLNDDAVSKQHLELNITPHGYRVSDLASSNGTFLGAVRLGEVTVTSEVTLRLGQRTLRLVPSSEEVEVPASSRNSFGRVLGRSVVMRELYDQLETIAKSDSSLILEGETGVGKELVAESVHAASSRAARPFVVVDCAALAGPLLESELFGHVRGAFTGADTDREGLLSVAEGGSVFLDDLDELPLSVQAKLLGALERRHVTPIGSSNARPIDVRFMASSRRNLARLVNERRFRADLFYRVAVVRLRVPPLRARPEDIPMLVEAFLDDLRAREGAAIPESLSAMALASLADQPWPGNVRELRGVVERAALGLPHAGNPPPRRGALAEAREQARTAFERAYFQDLLARTGRNHSQVARLAQIDRRYLLRILARLQLRHP